MESVYDAETQVLPVITDVEIRTNPLPLLGRVLVLPRSTFARLAADDAVAWPYALGLITFVAFAKAVLGGMLAWRGGVTDALLPVAAVRYGDALLGPLVFALFAAGLLQLAQRLWQGDARFQLTLSAVSLALMPLAVRDLLQFVYMAARQHVLLHPGLSALVAPPARDAASRLVYAMLGSFDAFTMWAFVLLALGMSVTQGRGWGRQLAAVFVVTALWIVIASVPAYLVTPLFAH